MKKRKVGFLFNIITICLAVVAIAVGVYSLQKSSLNISGSLGFTAHAVNARIDAYMYGYATEVNGIPLTESEKVRLTSANGLLIQDTLTNYNLNLGATNGSGSATRYFSNLGASGKMEDIVVEITVSNTSSGTSTPKNILANVDFANCIHSSALTGKIRIDCDRSAAVLETTNGKTQATFTFKISLLPNTEGSYGDSTLTTPSNNVDLRMNLEETTYTQSQVRTDAIAIKKFTATEVSSIKSTLSITTNDSYADIYPYYIEMGERENQGKIKWLIIGTRTIDSDNNETYAALTTEDKTAFSKGLMLNKTYVMLSEKVLYTESTDNYGISFQNAFADSSSTTPAYKNTNNDYSAQDYATSNVRSYLKGNTVQRASSYASGVYSPSGTQVNLMTTYNLADDKMYNKIQGRTLTSLYSNIGTFNSSAIKWSSDYSGTDENLKGTTSDKLWLLSESEVTDLLGTTSSLLKTSTYGGTASRLASWWLRSPYSSRANYVRYVTYNGSLLNDSADHVDHGSRAAFLF